MKMTQTIKRMLSKIINLLENIFFGHTSEELKPYIKISKQLSADREQRYQQYLDESQEKRTVSD